MNKSDRSGDISRRSFFSAVFATGVASLLSSPSAHAETSAAKSGSGTSAITPIVANNFVGSGVNYAHTVKAGPSFSSMDMKRTISHPDSCKPSKVRTASRPLAVLDFAAMFDYLLDRMGKVLKIVAPTFPMVCAWINITRIQNSTRAYHLARFANMGNWIPLKHVDYHGGMLWRGKYRTDLSDRVGS